ncbi:hypothetical protein BpHYR1_034940 [Brachionus plicatilis]|uniref:Uncharacterized protein n=1 Tax=Brachionus plicatilis TaxID=10195 RepID=A0A3M7QY31_BRAPC|nr:hypothetical protein BpHYR1_034940 [Brachionus plicatilis]
MMCTKLWLISNARFFEQNQFKKIETDTIRQFLNLNYDRIKRSLLSSNEICEDLSELSVLYVQSKFAFFYKEMFEWIKKHKKIAKNFSFSKEVENTDLRSIYEVYRHLSHEKCKFGIEIILKHFHLNKHYNIFKQFNCFNVEMFILIYSYSLLVYIMCLYIVMLFVMLYF